MIRFGVVGAGWFASRRHLPELAADPRVELAALCRRSAGPLATLADVFGVPGRYTDPAEMLAAESLDAVLISSPHHLHHAHAVACLEAGCHLLMEKPMTLTVAEARDLVERAAAADRRVEVAYNPPYWSHCVWLRERIADGELGDIEFCDLRWTGSMLGVLGREPLPDNLPGLVPPTLFRGNPAENGGGVLVDNGSHQVCEAMYVTGRPWTRLGALMDAVPEDVRYTVQFEMAGGGLGSLTCIGDSRRANRQSIATYSGTRATVTITGAPFAARWSGADGTTTQFDEADFPATPQPVTAFVDTLVDGAPQRSSAADCLRYVQAIEAAYESASTGRTVELPPC